MPAGDGYISMFDGKTLEGWQGFVGNPIAVEEDERKGIFEKVAELPMTKCVKPWSVKDGTIVFNGHGCQLMFGKTIWRF